MATVPFDAPEMIEDLDDIVDPNETIDDGNLLLPSGQRGEAPQYTSTDRIVKWEKRAVKKGQYIGKPFLSVTIELSSLEDEAGNVIKLRRPMRTWVNTLRWPNGPGRVGVRPSSVDQYLEACGIGYTGLSGAEIQDALGESATAPCVVHIGWEERVEKAEDGSYPDPRFKTGDFKNAETGEFSSTIQDEDGEDVTARNVVTYFSKV